MMKSEFNRTDGLFSLCGLNCGLCPMQIRGQCSGCFNGSTCYQTCPIAPCSVKHGNVDYCFQCGEYPCKRYEGIDSHDSLISHRNQKRDMAKAKERGIEAYELERRGHKFVRYADDMVIFCKSRASAEQTLAHIIPYIEKKLFLKVNREKTVVAYSFQPTTGL